MILITVLLLTIALLIMAIVAVVSTIGAGAIIIFGDVIVCIVFMVLLIKFLIKRKHEKDGEIY